MTSRNIWQRINAVLQEIDNVEKTGTNTHQNYKFVEDPVVAKLVREAFVKHGIGFSVSQPTPPEMIGQSGKVHLVQVHQRFKFVNVDNPEDFIESDWYGCGGDTSDKAIAKACTSSQKYYLMKALILGSDQDADSTSPEVTRTAYKPIDTSKYGYQYDIPYNVSKSISQKLKDAGGRLSKDDQGKWLWHFERVLKDTDMVKFSDFLVGGSGGDSDNDIPMNM